jgi:hypothetical protein
MKKRAVFFALLAIVAVVAMCIIRVRRPEPYEDDPLGI